MPNGISWNSINANFGDTASLMNAAQQGISNAGTIFNQAVSGIRDYQKMELDNAYKQRSLDESIRQFDAKFGQDADQFREKMALEADKLTQAWDIAVMQDRTNRLKAQAEMANASATRGLAAAKFENELRKQQNEMYGNVLDTHGNSIVAGDLSNLNQIIPDLQQIAASGGTHAARAQAMLRTINEGLEIKPDGTVEPIVKSKLAELREAAAQPGARSREKAVLAAASFWGDQNANKRYTDIVAEENKEQREMASAVASAKRQDNKDFSQRIRGEEGNIIRDIAPGSKGNDKVFSKFINTVDNVASDAGLTVSKAMIYDFFKDNGAFDAWTDTTFTSRIERLMPEFLDALAHNQFNLTSYEATQEQIDKLMEQLDKVKIANRTVKDYRESRQKEQEQREAYEKMSPNERALFDALNGSLY